MLPSEREPRPAAARRSAGTRGGADRRRSPGRRLISRMISSPSLRSVPTVKSAESVSPSAGSAFCAAAGAQPPGTARASAHSDARARCRQRGLASARVGRWGRRRDMEAARPAGTAPSPRMMHRKYFPFVSPMVARSADPSPLTHFDAQGQAHMVDVAAKGESHRRRARPERSGCCRRRWR
jgi:Molybdenum cofactor biosynthesis enzyme